MPKKSTKKSPSSKPKSKKEQAAEDRRQSDITAQAVGREDVDYSDISSTPMTHVTNAQPLPQKPQMTMEEWRRKRAARGALEKPGGKKN